MDAALEAQKRAGVGKNEARRLRAAGRIPAVVYGGGARGDQPVGTPIAVDPKALSKILRSESGVNTLISLELEGDAAARVLIKEYQVDPISHKLLHADFFCIAMDRALTVTVPVLLRGEARGVKQQAGIMDFVLREIEVECLPGDIPEHIGIDVSELLIGQGVRVRDLAQDARWKPLDDPDALIIHVMPPRAEEAPAEAEPTAAAVAAEPEVIKKGRTEKEEPEG
jgi:large subunit ribosomal protein L25